MGKFSIYVLKDPVTLDVRYVGITSGSLKQRLKGHVQLARKGSDLYSSRWIRKVLSNGQKPLIELIELTEDHLREAFWISDFESQGANLTNSASGGLEYFSHSEEVREKISLAGTTRFKDLSGQTFNRLYVVSVASHRPLKYNCKCSCGVEKVLAAQAFQNGGVGSCGCLARALAAQRCRDRAKHGKWKTREFSSWQEMKARCYNPKHAKYASNGALGCRVCDEWVQDFSSFLRDMGEKQVLVRKNMLGDYNPQNCYWGTRSELKSSVARKRNL